MSSSGKNRKQRKKKKSAVRLWQVTTFISLLRQKMNSISEHQASKTSDSWTTPKMTAFSLWISERLKPAAKWTTTKDAISYSSTPDVCTLYQLMNKLMISSVNRYWSPYTDDDDGLLLKKIKPKVDGGIGIFSSMRGNWKYENERGKKEKEKETRIIRLRN